MDQGLVKLRTNLDALAKQTAALSARVETLERQAAEEAKAKAEAAAAKSAKSTFFAKPEKK